MRQDGFLRTPVRADHQSRMLNLTISEQMLVGNPLPGDAYPQTLFISFDIGAGTTEVQIAPLWEGILYFLSDDTTNYPTVPTDITEANFANWPLLLGDLVLHTADTSVFKAPFSSHIPLVSPPPSSVRYSKVRLTRDFLFSTLRNTTRDRFTDNGQVVDKRDPLWHAKFVISFIRGRAGLWCPVHPDNPAQDFAHNAMPSVALEPPGTTTTLRVTIATRVAEAIDPSWFTHRPEYDDVSGERFVDPAIDAAFHQRFNPAHSSHSVISAIALFQNAVGAAYAPEHDANTPLRGVLSAPRVDGRIYRRINLIRPPIPGAETMSNPQRPFPMYQLVWRSVAGPPVESLRIPLTGRLYLPLLDGDYTFWVIPRSQNPQVILSGDQIRLSVKTPPRRYIDLPSTTLAVTVGPGENTKTIYAHALEYDSKRVWAAFVELGNDFLRRKVESQARWNVDVLNLFIFRSPAMADYAPIYGYIRTSAGRHGLAPEFLQAVFMGEGVGGDGGLIEQNRTAIPRVPFCDTQVIDGFVDLGLDEIQDSINNLIADGYLDTSFNGVLTNRRTVVNEVGEMKNTADVVGWEAAIELVAAELHSRLDQMLAYASAQGIPITTEEQRRYLAYIRYLSSVPSSRQHADNIDMELRRWSGPPPPPPPPFTASHRRRFAFLRIAVAEWQEAAEVYR